MIPKKNANDAIEQNDSPMLYKKFNCCTNSKQLGNSWQLLIFKTKLVQSKNNKC